jgi:predicted tellurium resistance membrane protein TerC
MRGVFIAAGAYLLQQFHWVIYVFGAILVLTGVKLAMRGDAPMDPEKNPVTRLARRFLPLTPRYHGQRFWVREGGRLVATPLFLVLLLVEFTDLVFAIDSIPAIFAVTQDPFIVYTSNVFAILGLRSLYFLLAGVVHRFVYLKYGLALVLVFVGIKMLLVDVYKIPILASLGFIAAVLAGSIGASLLRRAPAAQVPTGPAAGDRAAAGQATAGGLTGVVMRLPNPGGQPSRERLYASSSRRPLAAMRRAAATVFGTGSPQAAAVSAKRVGLPAAVTSGGRRLRP